MRERRRVVQVERKRARVAALAPAAAADEAVQRRIGAGAVGIDLAEALAGVPASARRQGIVQRSPLGNGGKLAPGKTGAGNSRLVAANDLGISPFPDVTG